MSAGTYVRAHRPRSGRAARRRRAPHRAAARGDRRAAGGGRGCRSTRSARRRCCPPSQVLGHLPAVELDPRPQAAVRARTGGGRRGARAARAAGRRGAAAGRRAGRGGAGRRRLAQADRGAGDRVIEPRGPAAPLPRSPNGTVVTVGSFDGVHLGHQAVLQEIAERAEAAGRASVLVTFEPHPLEVVNPQAAPPLLTTGPERREILAQTPLDYVLLPAVRPAARRAHARGVRARRAAGALRDAGAGDRARPRLRPRPERRRRHAAPPRRTIHGFDVDVVPPVDVGDQHVSSSPDPASRGAAATW